MGYNRVVNAVIIGGSGGIGNAVSLCLAEKVDTLCVHAGHGTEKFSTLIKKLEKKVHIVPLIHNFSIKNGYESFFKKFYASPLNNYVETADILCVCYGPFLQKAVHSMTEQEWLEVSFFNYTFPGILVSKVLPGMIERKFGRIILFGGTRTESLRAYKTNAAYGGAKTALCTLVKSVAAEYGQYGITCNAVLPGFVDTEYISLEDKYLYSKKMPQREMIHPESIASAVLFLIENSDISGDLFRVDAGLNL